MFRRKHSTDFRQKYARLADYLLDWSGNFIWEGAHLKNMLYRDSHADLQMEQNLKKQNIGERRKAARFDIFFAMPTLKGSYRGDGYEIAMINMSRKGALIGSREQMPVGSDMLLRVVTEETVYIIKGRITRSSISPPNERMFQTGIEFDKDFTPLPSSIELLELFEDDEEFLK